MATKKKLKLADLPAHEDASAELDSALLLRAAQPVLKTLAADLLRRAKESPAVTAALRARHRDEKEAERTADPYETWLRAFVEQVAAAWLLSCVFVRVLEDRGLVEQNRIAGPGALDSQQLFFELAPSLSERDYLRTVFRELSELPAAADLFDARHNPVWLLAPSAEGARALLELFRTPSPHAPALRFGQSSTRFLGDLYQDLSETVRDRYALWQTPDFIEEFILDRTLERAIERFGLDETTLIDPTCGSGHFLLGAFDRLVEHRLRREPGIDVREAALKALDAVSGADLNPYAIAIARFRLTLAYLEKAGHTKLAQAPKLPLHLAVADSLLHNPQEQIALGEVEGTDRASFEGEIYALEDEGATRDVLYRRYAAVVGNPPYITPKDARRSRQYKKLYRTAVGAYHLSSPFIERVFQLTRSTGCIGLITDNAFMKREYGKSLVEDFLPTVNVDRVVDTSGAFIPGHGTPTVLLFGTAEPEIGNSIPAVLPKRGEPSTPADPRCGRVWSSIQEHWNEQGFENDFISVENVEREWLHRHPWVLAGGGAIDLFKTIEERVDSRLGSHAEAIGRTTHTGEDTFFFMPAGAVGRLGIASHGSVLLVKGEQVRDWSIAPGDCSLFPYSTDADPRDPDPGREANFYWTYRRLLRNRKDYGEFIEERTQDGRRLRWFEHSMFFPKRYRTRLGIAFAEVATHNHFVLDRGGKVFNRSAPIIKLPENATEDDHLALLAYLNSSTFCFWIRQVAYPKGMHNGSESNATSFLVRYVYDSTKLSRVPLPARLQHDQRLRAICRELDELARERARVPFDELASKACDAAQLADLVKTECERREQVLQAMIALQDEIDWRVYELFGLDEPTSACTTSLAMGQRPFEQAIAERPDDSVDREWFRWNETQPVLSPPADASPEERDELARRRAAIAESPSLRLLESPECKRRWVQPAGKGAQGLQTDRRALIDEAGEWTQAEVEAGARAFASSVFTRSSLETHLRNHRSLSATLEWLADLGESPSTVRAIVDAEAVPFLAADRYTDAGMDKRAAWERTWELQRREDAGEEVGDIPVPPKYAQGDFQSSTYWRLRGKLDVPKERFISYPGCESDEDGEPLYGWAGWNHLERAQALAALYEQRKSEGWDPARLTPMLAGILELVPWVEQWHNEPSDEYDGMRLGDYFQGYLDGECAQQGLGLDDLRAWRPPEKRKAKRSKKKPSKDSS